MPILTKSGQDNQLSAGGDPAEAEYPCVRRLRHLRFLAFLWLQGFKGTFGSMVSETDAYFSVSHLRYFVERGQWNDAVGYLCHFLPSELDRLGLEAQVLRRFLVAHMALANILAGTKEGYEVAAKYSQYGNHGGSFCRGILRLRSIMLTVFHSKQQLRVSLDWERVRRKASEIVYDLAHRTQELKGLVLPLAAPMRLGNDSIGSRRRCHLKKQSCRPRASTLAKRYLQKKRSLFSSSHTQESHDELSKKAMNWVADVVDECLKAGKRLELHQVHPVKPSGREGVTSAPVRPTMFGTFAGPATYPGILYAANAGKLATHVPTPGAPFSGTIFGAPVSQTVFGCLTNPDKSSKMSLVTDAGTNKHSSQDRCNAESSQQGPNPWNHPRVELTTSDGQDHHPKRQRATGAFGEASLMSVTET